MQHHKIKIPKTAHYYTLGEPSPKVKYFWFVTHGYGQLASNFIRKFEIFKSEEHFVVAPEALNRFYWDMRKGIVGANWMTKLDRLDEIEDYSNFLTTVYNEFMAQLSPDVKIIFLGFSQGVATQMRWIQRAQPLFHHLVFWGGVLPEDIDYLRDEFFGQPLSQYLSDKKIHFINGDEDEFVTPDKTEWHLDFAKTQNIDLNYIPFKGKHEILTDVLDNFTKQYIL